MPITVKLLGDLGRFTDSPTVTLEGGPFSLAAALDELVSRCDPLKAALFGDADQLRQSILLVVEGRALKWPEDRDTMIADRGELLLMRYLAGG